MSQEQILVDLGDGLLIDDILVGTQDIFRFRTDNHTDLLTETGMVIGDLAYVRDAEGTKWLPGTLGGSYYPNGIYIYDGANWVSDRNAIVEQLEKNRAVVDTVSPAVTDDNTVGKHQVGQVWVNSTTGDVFAAVDLSTGAAVWNRLNGGTDFNVNLNSAESSVSRVFTGGRTTFTVTHSLNTLDKKPVVFRISDGRNIGWRIERTDVNNIDVSRNGNIADGLFRILI